MSLVAATVVPAAPLLVPALAGGSAGTDDALRRCALDGVAWLLRAPGPVLVVGTGPGTGPVVGTWNWSGFGVDARGGDGPALPASLGIGAWLLDAVDPARPRTYLSVGEDEPGDSCAAFGASSVAAADLRLLVVADGSARRTEKAPGYLDPRAEAFDDGLERGLRRGDPGALLALDAALARDLLARGRAPLQVLAGAAEVRRRAVVDLTAAPYGVLYVVARWGDPADPAESRRPQDLTGEQAGVA